jgi:hypothetical protein
MPAVPDRQQIGSEELREFPMTGPFGGIQSELPLTAIEQLGFADVSNFILRIGRASLRPGYTDLSLPAPAEPLVGFANFFDVDGDQIQIALTPTRLMKYHAGVWTEITGAGFSGSSGELFSCDVLNYKLCFSQGSDKIWYWDGKTATYAQATNSPITRYLAEIASHLFAVCPTFPQRYYWSGIGDLTDWTGYTAGLNDQVTNLGPINGILKLGQYGFGFQQFGIVQIIPTGIGLAPFAFQAVINATQSTIAPYSLDKLDDHGMELAVYLGVDNVYLFNGVYVEPIGDRPLEGRRRVGARSRILADVLMVDPRTITGRITYSIAGNPFKAYWLSIPNAAVWVYNFDEGNWTRFAYQKTVNTMAPFLTQNQIRIMDLIGTIAQQSWTFASLDANNPFTGFALGFADGTVGYVDSTNYSESAGSIVSGKLIFDDRRHRHTIKKFRLAVVDKGAVTYTIKIENENGYSQTKSFTLGSGSGDELSFVQEFSISGLRLQWTISVPAGAPAEIIEFAPMADTSGEQRGGKVEN